MTSFVIALCWGLAASSTCNTMTDKPELYDSLTTCITQTDWLNRSVAQGDEHYECLRYDGREVYQYVEITKR